MQSLLKFLEHIAKSFGISSPSDNVRKAALRKEKQNPSTSFTSGDSADNRR
jgi:hypothetical protein